MKGPRQRWQDWRYRRAMRRLRDHMAWFGRPVDHLSDEELERAVYRFGQAAKAATVPASQVQKSMAQMGRAVREAESKVQNRKTL